MFIAMGFFAVLLALIAIPVVALVVGRIVPQIVERATENAPARAEASERLDRIEDRIGRIEDAIDAMAVQVDRLIVARESESRRLGDAQPNEETRLRSDPESG